MKTPVRTWRVRYAEPGYDYNVFYMWFHDERHAKEFAQKHDRVRWFHPEITHVPYESSTRH